MNKETDEALEESIQHWKDNIAAETPLSASVNADDCALCHLFVLARGHCGGCPVQIRTGKGGCAGTPYIVAKDAFYAWQAKDRFKVKRFVYRKKFRKAAQALVDFLESLRANTEPDP